MQEANLYTITFPPMRKALKALSTLLDTAKKHADAKKLAWADFEEALVHDRLVFDQFPLAKQIQVACDNAKAAAGHLAGIDVPKHEDDEKTIAQLKARIEKTLAFLEKVKSSDVVGKENVQVKIPYFPGKYMTGFEYANEYLIPNFFFHVTTAYSILRKNGIAIGKADYMGGLPLKDL